MQIRKARADEAKLVQQLNHELILEVDSAEHPLDRDWSFGADGQRYVEGVISGERGVCFVADDDGEVVGYVAGCLRQPAPYRPVRRTELENMFVREGKRGNGAGKELVDAFRQWSREQGAEYCLVDTFAINDDGKSFYEKMGFSSDTVEMESRL